MSICLVVVWSTFSHPCHYFSGLCNCGQKQYNVSIWITQIQATQAFLVVHCIIRSWVAFFVLRSSTWTDFGKKRMSVANVNPKWLVWPKTTCENPLCPIVYYRKRIAMPTSLLCPWVICNFARISVKIKVNAQNIFSMRTLTWKHKHKQTGNWFVTIASLWPAIDRYHNRRPTYSEHIKHWNRNNKTGMWFEILEIRFLFGLSIFCVVTRDLDYVVSWLDTMIKFAWV